MEQTNVVLSKIEKVAEEIEKLCKDKPDDHVLANILANIHILRHEYHNLLSSLGSADKIAKLEKEADLLYFKAVNQ